MRDGNVRGLQGVKRVAHGVEVLRQFFGYSLVPQARKQCSDIEMICLVRALHRFNIPEEVSLSLLCKEELLLMLVKVIHPALDEILDDFP